MSSSRYLLRHTSYALACFAVAILAMETFMPGSVMPYIDPVPFGILAVIALGASALYPVRESRRIARTIVLVLVAIIMSGIAFLVVSMPGARSLIALALLSSALILSALMVGGSSSS